MLKINEIKNHKFLTIIKNIKIILLLPLLIIFFKYQALSQFSDRFGVNLILSASKQNIEHYYMGNFVYRYKTDNLFGMGIGIFYEVFKTKSIILILNTEYVRLGTEAYALVDPGSETFIEVKTYNRIDYISLPFIAKILFFNNNYIPQILLGIRIDCMVSHNSDYLDRYFKEANDFVFGGLFGIGWEIKLNNFLTILPIIKYNFDFNNAINFSYNYDELKFKNRSIDFSLGVKIK